MVSCQIQILFWGQKPQNIFCNGTVLIVGDYRGGSSETVHPGIPPATPKGLLGPRGARCVSLGPRPRCRCWPSRSDLGERWPSRLVATAVETRLSVRRNPIHNFLVPIEPLSSWCLIFALSIQIGRKRSPYNLQAKEESHTNLARRAQMRFASTALVMMAMALMLLALTLLTTNSGP
jgi:hypothetical protein